jgi:mRNA-degrading endonuclease RelE of RelBE toxin-antitoxin system
MQVKYVEDFDKSVKKINDKIALKRLDVLIEKLKSAKDLNEISNVEPLTNNPLIYRIKTGDFRLIVRYIRGSIEILLVEFLRRNEKTYRQYK